MSEQSFLNKTIVIDKLLDAEINSETEIGLFDLIKDNKELEDYAIIRMRTIQWFDFLEKYGYLKWDKSPKPELTTDGKGYYLGDWNILIFFETISEELLNPSNEKYVLKILELIKEVSIKLKPTEGTYDNNRTWWHFAKILSLLPNQLINKEILDNIELWFFSAFNNILTSSEIVENLIPKFLKEDSTIEDIEKAEKIISIISKTKKSKKVKISDELKQLFGDDDKYLLLCDGYYFKEFIDKNDKLIAEKCSNELILELCNNYKVTMQRETDIYTFYEGELSVGFAVTKDKNNYQVLVEVYNRNDLEHSNILKKKLEPVKSGDFKISADNLSEFSINLQKVLIDNKFLLKDIERMRNSRGRYIYYGPYSLNCWESIYDDSYLSYHYADDMILYALKNILIKRSNIKHDLMINLLNNLLLDDYFIFKKLAMYIITESSIDYSDVFWEAFESGDNSNILLEESFFGDELRNLFSKISLTNKQQKLLLTKIEEGPKFHYSEIGDHYFNTWKRKIFKALVKYPIFKKKHDELTTKDEKDYDLGPAIGETKTDIVDDESKITEIDIDKILNMSNEEIVKNLSKVHKIETLEIFDNFYASYFHAIKTKPDKFTKDLQPFLQADKNDIFHLIYNLSEAWKNKRYFDWNNLFNFISSFLDKINFSEINEPPDYKSGSVSIKDIIGYIGNLIQDGTRTDDNAFPPECNEKARKILLLILSQHKNLLNPYESVDRHDSYLFALNTILGKNIFALILLSLREARLEFGNKQDDTVKWNKANKIMYENLLGNSIYEAYLFLGNSIRNFLYLDPIWIKGKISEITKLMKKNTTLWNAFMDGYLTNHTIGKDLFKLMKDNYEYSIDFEFNDKSSGSGLIRHITLAYLNNYDNLTNGLISKIITRENYEDYREIIFYFWGQRDILLIQTSEENKKLPRLSEQRKLILEFWKKVYNIFSQKVSYNDNDKKILSLLGRLAVYIDSLNEDNIKLLILSARYATYDFVSPYFIEYLNNFKDKIEDKNIASFYIGKIYFAMLENDIPDYDMKNIKEIIEFLFTSGNIDAIKYANNICNKYAEKGNYALKSIWEKYNNINSNN